MEPSYLRFRCYEPVIVGGFMVTTLPDVIDIKKDVGGFRVTTICVVGGFLMPITSGKVVTINPPTITGS